MSGWRKNKEIFKKIANQRIETNLKLLKKERKKERSISALKSNGENLRKKYNS